MHGQRGAAAQQVFSNLGMPVIDGIPQRRVAERMHGRGQESAVFGQEAHHVEVTARGGFVKGAFAFVILGVDDGAGLHHGFGAHHVAFAGKLEVGFDVIGAAREFGLVGQHGFDALALAHERLRTRGIGPDGWVGGLLFNIG